MTAVPPRVAGPAKPPGTAPRAAPPGAKKAPPKGGSIFARLFASNAVAIDVVANERVEKAHHDRLLKLVFTQTAVIFVLTFILIATAPFFRPYFLYYAVDTAGQVAPMSGLTMPNMTNQAVLSWSVTSVTEIMTIGFGDFERRLLSQKPRFTTTGWDSFVGAFLKQKIGESFKEHQLVLTTVPSNTAVILSQGQNKEGIYEWKVQVPVVMTYATNDNVTRHERTVITLTIVRVPTQESSSGVAIKTWAVKT